MAGDSKEPGNGDDPLDKLSLKGIAKYFRDRFTRTGKRLDSIEYQLIAITEQLKGIDQLRKENREMEKWLTTMLNDKFSAMERLLSSESRNLGSKIDDLRGDTSKRTDDVRDNLGSKIDNLREDLYRTKSEILDDIGSRSENYDENLRKAKDDIKNDIKYILDSRLPPPKN